MARPPPFGIERPYNTIARFIIVFMSKVHGASQFVVLITVQMVKFVGKVFREFDISDYFAEIYFRELVTHH